MDEIPITNPMPYRNPAQNYGGSIVQLTNPDSELRKMEQTFRSIIVDKKGTIIQVGDPLMNELGISSVIGQVQSIVNRVTILSNLNEKEVPILIDFLGDTIAKDLMVNRKAYEIESPATRDKIFFSAITTSFVCMKRSFNQGERIFWSKIQQEIKTIVEGQQKKDNWLSNIVGWGKTQ